MPSIKILIDKLQKSFAWNKQRASQAIGFIFKSLVVMRHHHHSVSTYKSPRRLVLKDDVRQLMCEAVILSPHHMCLIHNNKIGFWQSKRTPLGLAEWSFSQHHGLPTLYPSIGNWQVACRSHYFITEGQVRWAPQWSDAQIAAGQRAEQQRRHAYYDAKDRKPGFWARILTLLRKLFGY